MGHFVTFGEIMLRLEPPGHERLRQARQFTAVFGGAEANVAVSLATLGEAVEYVTRLPANELGEACLGFVRQHGVGVAHILRGGERLGLYFVEKGAAQRGSKVVYDRAGSSFATIRPGMVDWRTVFAEASWFHWTGITPAIAAEAADACREAIVVARDMGLTISCDLNYRHALWRWGASCADVMPDLVAACDVVVGNTETAETMFGIPAPAAAEGAEGPAEPALEAAGRLAARFPNLSTVAFTLRGSRSASHNTWSGVLWRRGEGFTGPTYDLVPIVDRVGGGDAFTAGLLYGLRHRPDEPAYALQFGLAAGCLKHSIPGDSNLVTVAEVEQLMAGDGSGRISR